MGASTLAFFPTRFALICEGPTEILLFPRIFREALGVSEIEFQIVSGLSNWSPKGLSMIDRQSSGVCYFIDNDSGGKEIKKKLASANFPEEYVFSVENLGPKLVTLEDPIEEKIWIKAVNLYIAKFGEKCGGVEPILATPKFGRVKSLPEVLVDQKVGLCYAVLEIVEK